MTPRNRSGFTLIELLVALIMLLIVGGSMYNVLIAVQRTSRSQAEVATLHSNIRTGVQIVTSDLQELFADSVANTGSDITAMNASSMSYDALRGSGLICDVVSTTQVKVRNSSTWSGFATPATNNTAGVIIFVDFAQDQSADDIWLKLPVSAIAASTCPDATAAWSMTLSTALTGAQQAGIAVPAPVRTYEQMQLGVVTDLGRNWLGLRSLTAGEAALVPIAGPLQAGGLELKYWLSNGTTETADVDYVKSITLRLIGETDRAVNAGLGSATSIVADSLKLRIQLRNAR